MYVFRTLVADLRDVYSPNGVVYTTLDELHLHKRCTAIRQLQDHIRHLLSTATVIEDTVDDIKSVKDHLLKLSADV